MSPTLEAIILFMVFLVALSFLAIDALFFYIKQYDICKDEFAKFLNSLSIIHVANRRSKDNKLLSVIGAWFYSEPVGFGNSRPVWLFFCVVIGVFLPGGNIRLAFIQVDAEQFVVSILFLIIAIPIIYKVYHFGSKLKEFQEQ